MKAWLSFFVLASSGFLACGKKDPPATVADSSPAAPSASVAVVSASASTSANPAGALETPSLGAIAEKLDSEQKNRPNVQPSVDKVFDTITGKLAIAIENKKQVAAFTAGARYCVMASTKNDVYVVACEYSDPASATKGVERTSVTNKMIKRREVLRKNSTTLAIQQSGETKAAEAEAKKMHDAFLALE